MKRAEKLTRAVDRRQQQRPILAFPVAVWTKFSDDRAGNLAALVAFSAFASIFPLLLVLVTLLDMTLRSNPKFREEVVNSALSQYPVIGDQIKSNIHGLSSSGLPLAIGLVLLLFGARGVATSMQNALNTVWLVPMADRPSGVRALLRSLGIIVVIGAGVIVAGFLSGISAGTGHLITGVGAHIGLVALSAVVNIAVFWVVFRLATPRSISWGELFPGAAVAAIAWQILLSFGGYIVGHQLHRASALYGTFGVVLGLMTWLFLQAQLTLYAAEAGVVRARRLWPRSVKPPPYTEQDRRAYALYAQAQRRWRGERIKVRMGSKDVGDT